MSAQHIITQLNPVLTP